MDGFYHVWFSTKNRKPALEGEIGEAVKRLLQDIAQRSSIHLVEAEAVVDHAHLLIRLAGNQTLSTVMHQLKGASSRYIFLTYPDLRFDLRTSSFWQKGYGWRKIDPGNVHTIRNYIRTQRQRPHRHNV